MNDLVYVMCNNKLVGGNAKKARRLEIDFEDINSDNEWICASDNEEGEPQSTDLEVGGEEGGHTIEGGDDAIGVDARRDEGDHEYNSPLDVDGNGGDDDNDDDLDANVEADELL
ncbi:unnamed protein product [Linum trigynum]|uniref:Uncharacterized protein n=1 Tax=Linum trigynum TaxID=586398 RepID=A0AAV2D624_9ROSI